MPADLADVAALLLRALAATEAGDMKPTVMGALANGARAYAAVHETGLLLNRVNRLESALDDEEGAA